MRYGVRDPSNIDHFYHCLFRANLYAALRPEKHTSPKTALLYSQRISPINNSECLLFKKKQIKNNNSLSCNSQTTYTPFPP